MKIVISGPFGYGTWADEIVLAGLLHHLKQHQVTVLTGNAKRFAAVHSVKAVEVALPRGLEMPRAAWEAVSGAHLFILASGGVLSEKGKTPARHWLSQLELARRAGIKTALIGAGAISIKDARERVRLQRLLHNFTDTIATRDDGSKDVLLSYGMNANAISANGDPGLALVHNKISYAPENRKLGLALSESVPSRECFATETQLHPGLQQSLRQLISLLQSQADQLVICHDDTDAAVKLAQSLKSNCTIQTSLQPANRPVAQLQRELAACRAVFSCSLHGLILAVTAKTPCIGLSGENGAATFLGSLGCSNLVVPTTAGGSDAEQADTLIVKAAEDSASIVKQLTVGLSVLAKKEAQNARTLEFLVPRRDRFDKAQRGR